MFLATKVHVISGMLISVFAIMAAKQMRKQRRMCKHSYVPTNAPQNYLHGCCDKANRETANIALRRLRWQNNFEQGSLSYGYARMVRCYGSKGY